MAKNEMKSVMINDKRDGKPTLKTKPKSVK